MTGLGFRVATSGSQAVITAIAAAVVSAAAAAFAANIAAKVCTCNCYSSFVGCKQMGFLVVMHVGLLDFVRPGSMYPRLQLWLELS